MRMHGLLTNRRREEERKKRTHTKRLVNSLNTFPLPHVCNTESLNGVSHNSVVLNY